MQLCQTPPPELYDLFSYNIRVQIENKEQAENAVRLCEKYGLTKRHESQTVDSILDGSSVWPKYGELMLLHLPYVGFCHNYESVSSATISYKEFLVAATGQELQPAFQFSGDFGDLFAGVS